MGVVNVRKRQERVEERLNRRTRTTWIEVAVRQVIYHRDIAHPLALQEWQHTLQIQSGKGFFRDGCEI
jgi:hypothetical protein